MTFVRNIIYSLSNVYIAMKQIVHSLRVLVVALFATLALEPLHAQALRLPQNTNFPCSAGRTVGVTDINIKWNAPGVKGREGKIWGTDVAWFGFTVLGFGSDVESPWRAGADESTVISFSTDVTINGKPLAAGKYGFFIALYPDSSVLIFNKNVDGWGSYFYRKDLDALRVTTLQQKNQPINQERLAYNFYNQTDHSIEVALEWEHWKIPFQVNIDTKATTLAYIKSQMSGAIGFDAPSMQAAANWCVTNDVNLEEALHWVNTALNPSFGGVKSFGAYSTKSKILEKQGDSKGAAEAMALALENGTAFELHTYGRQLLGQKKPKEAMAVFEKNYQKQNGAWPTNVGMMRGYNGIGDLKNALKYAKLALAQAPDDVNKNNLTKSVQLLEQGKPLE